MNGPRTLSNDRLSYLIVSRTPTSDSYPSPPQTPSVAELDASLELMAGERMHEYEWFMCAAHFIGDGMALHAFANDFFGLLGSSMSDQELSELMILEWEKRWGNSLSDGVRPLICSRCGRFFSCC